ncbi:UNVERIFIED_CONTAM: Disease resistance protein [Sesamum radiatum]|uniref:Disease resistance protein n=1 Tax=Sesamum radiatum TaxID=300843 RepID=A0AAW2NSB9_SESRA
MGAEVILPLEVLSGEEAWILFSDEAGISNDTSNLVPIAKEVANECKGLPIALVSVARALKHKSKPLWDDALLQLKRSMPTNIPGFLKDVYRPLELSYSHLEGNEAQNLFLLCSLFREDSNICIEDLVRYGIGLTIFNGIKNLREGRNRTHALIEILKDRFLLVDGDRKGYVKVHDVVRDFAILIASKNEHRFLVNFDKILEDWRWTDTLRDSYEHYTHMSLFSGSDFKILPAALGKLTNLRLLDLTDCQNLQVIEQGVFAGMVQLEELNLTNSYAAWEVYEGNKKNSADLTELELLLNLKSLSISIANTKECNTVDYLAVTADAYTPSSGVFPTLETLHLREIPNMKEICHGPLPAKSFGELQYLHLQALNGLRHLCSGPTPNLSLSNLKSIYIYECRNLVSLFSTCVAESMVQLEELDVGDCQMMNKVFFHEERKDNVTNSNLEFPKLNKLVLRCLHTVTSFCIKIDRISFPQLMVLKMEDLPRFKGFCPAKSSQLSAVGRNTDLQILFNKKVASPRIKMLKLRMLDEMSKVFSQQGFFRELEFLEVDACQGLSSLFSPSVARDLVKLKELRIRNGRRLTGLIEKENKAEMNTYYTVTFCSSKTPGIIIFHQLEYLEVDACDCLEVLFSPLVAQGLVKLKELRIRNCKRLVEVIEKEDEQVQMNNGPTLFPQLKYLELLNVPNMTSFWHTNYEIKIPSLRHVTIDTNILVAVQLKKIAKHAVQSKPRKLFLEELV